jgi:hypothetical protein
MARDGVVPSIARPRGQTVMPNAMSNTGKGVIGAFALTLGALGAAQLAFGQDLATGFQSFSGVSNYDVNRTAKTDRAPRVTTPASPMQTISVQLSGLTETSVVVRIPVTQDERDVTPTPLLTNSAPKRPTVACEPVVSVLTDVAKQLQPGRCVT